MSRSSWGEIEHPDYPRELHPARENIASYVDFDAKVGYKLGGPAKSWEIAIAATNLFNVPHLEIPEIPVNGQPSTAPIPRRTWLELSGGF